MSFKSRESDENMLEVRAPRRKGLRRRLISLLALATFVVVVVIVGVYVTSLPRFSSAGRLASLLKPGMTLHDVEHHARALGFEWRVDEKQGERSAPDASEIDSTEPARSRLQIVCHQTALQSRASRSGSEYVCERREDVISFGAFFGSYTCNIIVEGGRVAESWFYMD